MDSFNSGCSRIYKVNQNGSILDDVRVIHLAIVVPSHQYVTQYWFFKLGDWYSTYLSRGLIQHGAEYPQLPFCPMGVEGAPQHAESGH